MWESGVEQYVVKKGQYVSIPAKGNRKPLELRTIVRSCLRKPYIYRIQNF